MKKYLLILLSFLFITNLQAKNMEKTKIQVFRNGEIPSAKGPAETFTGNVRVDSMLPNNHESHLSLATVTFEPGAKTAWHTHDWGQMLVITYGVSEVQEEGKEVIQVKEGDVVWFPAGVKHWHGATKDHAMSHISIVAETNAKKTVTWMEHVKN